MKARNSIFLNLNTRLLSHTIRSRQSNGLNQHQLCSARLLSTIVPFKLADIGEGIAEVELMKWFVKDGDKIKSFDRLCEVQSDKATVEITSRFDGIVAKIHHAEGDIVKVGEALVDIQTSGSSTTGKMATETKQAELATGKPVIQKSAPAASQQPTIQSSSNDAHDNNFSKTFATPAVRKLAKENNINLADIAGTGPKERVTKEDVLLYLQRGRTSSAPTRSFTPPVQSTASETKAATQPAKSLPVPAQPLASLPDQRVPIRGVQRMMVKSMTASSQVQHLTYCEEIVFNKFKALRDNLKANISKRYGLKLSYMPLIIKATSLALLQFPMLNATVNSDVTEMIYHGNQNIGIAMDTPKGLIVPVIRAVQLKSIVEIAAELNTLQDAAMKGTLTEAQLSGGTFTLSNIGSVGGTYATPVLVVPQVTIGAFGRLQVVPRYVNKHGHPATFEQIENDEAEVKPTMIMNVSWSADHRVVDGATVAKFSNLWKHYIENPDAMMTELR